MDENLDLKNSIPESEAKAAIKTILRYIGEDPNSTRLLKTAERVVSAYEQIFSGYNKDPYLLISNGCEENKDSSCPIVIKDIDFHSICEHHMMPFSGKAAVVYDPGSKIIGIGKVRKVVEIFARRLQIQERITSQVCKSIYNSSLEPKGVAVVMSAQHSCSYVRDYLSPTQSSVVTMHLCGSLDNESSKRDLMEIIKV